MIVPYTFQSDNLDNTLAFISPNRLYLAERVKLTYIEVPFEV